MFSFKRAGTTGGDVAGSCAEPGARSRSRAHAAEHSGVCVRVLEYKLVYMDDHQRERLILHAQVDKAAAM